MYHQSWQTGEVVVPTSRAGKQSLPDLRPATTRGVIVGESGERVGETSESTVEPNLGWYGYGELVIDRLIGVARCEVASVACISDLIPNPSLVRSRLGSGTALAGRDYECAAPPSLYAGRSSVVGEW